MRRLLSALALLATALTAAASATAAGSSSTAFVLTGGGWGHGVGMSQWGAFGQAKAGRSYDQILAYYYRGTTLGPSAHAPTRVRVLVADGLDSVTVSAPGPIVVDPGSGKRLRAAGTITIGAALAVTAPAGLAEAALKGPVTLRPTTGSHLTVAGKAYRGALVVARSAAGKLQLTNAVGLEAYLLGVVPGEMPRDWPLEALKAQAVAARTYALSSLVQGKSFDLYSDWRSQVYYGVGAEAPGTTRAVKETRGQTLSFDGAPAQTFYFSSSGGRTVSALDAFGEDVPYLVSVADPWDAQSPKHRWEPTVLGGQQLADRLGLHGAVSDVVFQAGVPGTPAALRVTTTAGSVSTEPLSDVRTRLGLDSLDFRIGVLRFDPPAAARRADGMVRVTGLARDADDVALERRVGPGSWVVAKRITPAADGSFTVGVRVSRTCAYRLTADGLAGPVVTLRAGA